MIRGLAWACLALLVVDTAVVRAQAVPAAQQVPPADQRQSANAQTRAAGSRQIEVTEAGPNGDAFKDVERPFPLAPWLCLPATTPAEELERKFADLLRDPAEREKCRKTLDSVKAGTIKSTAETTIEMKFNGGVPLAIRAFDATSGEPCDMAPVGGPGIGVVKLDLGALGCSSDRIDFAVVTQLAVQTTTAATRARDWAGQALAVFSVTFALPSNQFTTAMGRVIPNACVGGGTGSKDLVRYTVDLDATGVESNRFRNPRRPLFLDPNGPPPPGRSQNARAPGDYACAELEFENQIVTRQLVVTFSGLAPAARPGLTGVRGVSVQCQEGKCAATLRVGPASAVRIPLAALYKGYVDEAEGITKAEVVTFTVSFYDDDREPSFPRGYFSLVQAQYLVERKTTGTWASAASVEVSLAPDLTEFDAKYQPTAEGTEHLSVRANDWRTQGNVRVSFKQNLGSRVSTDFELRLKSGDFSDADPAVSTTRFRVDVQTLAGAVFSGGRAPVAAPSESIAIAEAGDSIGVRMGRFQFNHLFKKQVRDAALLVVDNALRADREHHTSVVQLTGLGVGSGATLDLYGTYGSRSQGRAPSDGDKLFVKGDRTYYTYGGELGWPLAAKVRWTTAGYRSGAQTDGAEATTDGQAIYAHPNDEGQGWVALSTLSVTNFDAAGTPAKRFVDWTLQVRGGIGSKEADGPDALHRQEAYAGESASFAPDVIFLKTLAPAAHVRDAEKPRLGVAGSLTPGLGNKIYAGAVLNIPRLDTLGGLIRQALGEDSVGDASANVRAHAYWSREGGRVLGRELDLNLAVEAPKGVKASLTTAFFWPGAGLNDASVQRYDGRLYVGKRLWSVVALVTTSVP